MKKTAYLPAMFALVFLAGGCTLPAVHDPATRPTKETKAEASFPPKKLARFLAAKPSCSIEQPNSGHG